MPTAFLASLRAFDDNLCPACGGTCPTLTYCEHLCTPGIQGHGTQAFHSRSRAYIEGEPRYPHIHRRCNSCGYEWVAKCRTPMPATGLPLSIG